jgi:L-threonylcarbamoyladenylate synthase
MQHQLVTVKQAATLLQAGKVIAYPTEAVYGLGCDPADESAALQIIAIKQRSAEAGLILIADCYDRLEPYTGVVSQKQMALARASWPGPVTWLFPRGDSVPDYLAGQHETIAVRVTDHPVCRALCSAFGGAVISTSANIARAPAATSPQQVMAYFDGDIEGVVEGELGQQSKPSEIRDLLSGRLVRAS